MVLHSTEGDGAICSDTPNRVLFTMTCHPHWAPTTNTLDLYPPASRGNEMEMPCPLISFRPRLDLYPVQISYKYEMKAASS